jgi:hypothetical protein
MKIEELPHIDIKRRILTNEELSSSWRPENQKKLFNRLGYLPHIDCMSDGYNILSILLDDDCVVAYNTDKSQTTFLIKTRQQYVGFICLSKRLAGYLVSISTRRITRIASYVKKDEFMEFIENDDLIVVDKDLWDKYVKTKLLEKLENE